MAGDGSGSTARLLRPVFAAVVNGQTDPPPPRRARRRRWLTVGGLYLPSLVEPALALILFLIGTDNPTPAHGPFDSGVRVVLSAAGAAPLLLRASRPLEAWRLSFVTIFLARILFAGSTGTPYPPTFAIVYLLCLYSVAVRCERAVTVGAMVLSTIGCVLLDPASGAFSLLCGVPLLLGYTVRVRRSTKRVLAEQEARHAGERAVLQERQRIARELHDVVAHHMSVIAIQAEAAPYKVTDPPPELAESFADIRSSALEGLNELRRILGVLRTDDAAQTAPQPGLDRLEEVVASARGGGLTVETTVAGEATVLPQGVGLSAYRILQEALSNAMKHAPGSFVRIGIFYTPDTLALRVTNGPGTGPRPVAGSGGGHGLVGMRERAAMLGGDVQAGPTLDGGFALAATLPLRPDPAAESTDALTSPERDR
jgi:signal transduction histidine kinase